MRYDFRCVNCERVDEVRGRVPPPTVVCSQCGSPSKRVWSRVSSTRKSKKREPVGQRATQARAHGITMERCTVTESGGAGVYFGKGLNGRIVGGTFKDNAGGNIVNEGNLDVDGADIG